MSHTDGVIDVDWRYGLGVRERNLYMMNDGILTDCVFFVGPDENHLCDFKVHRYVMCNASPVFEKMLTVEMSEAASGIVKIPDISSYIFYLVLKFVYADEVDVTTFEDAHDVAIAADKYQLTLLFEKSLSVMCDLVTPEHVWKALNFLHLLPHKPLKEACVKLLREDTANCLNTRAFYHLAHEDDVALLLEQEEVAVQSEVTLVRAAVNWARYETDRRALRPTMQSVRGILQQQLLPLLRFLTIPPELFVRIPPLTIYILTVNDKWALVQSMFTKDVNLLPPYLSKCLKQRKFNTVK